MPIFELQGPDGQVYEVDATDEKSALSAFAGQSAPQQQESSLPAAIADVPKEIGAAFNENVKAIHDGIIGQAERRREQPPTSFLQALGQSVSDTMGVGGALAAIPGIISSPVTGAARSLIGHPFADITGMPYEEAKGKVDVAMMAAAPRNFRASGPVTPPKPVPTAEEIEKAAAKGFDTARNSGVTVPAQDIQQLAQGVKSSLQADGFRDHLAPRTFSVLKELETPPQGAINDVADLHGIRRAFGKAAKSTDPTEREAASQAIKSLDQYLSSVSPELKEAIANYAAVKRSDTINARIDRADLNAASANSGQNMDNAIRQQIKGILTSEKERRGYSKDELGMMKSIVKATSPSNVMRGLGNILGGGGGLGTLASGGVGAATAGPIGIALPAVGWLVKQLGNRLTASRVAKLDEATRARSPLAQSVPSQVIPMPQPALGAAVAPQWNLPIFPMQLPAYAEEDESRTR